MMNPLFSVIIPTYNRADRLKITLDSLIAQTYKNFEVLVCDDGSTDDTPKVVENYMQKLNLHYIWELNWGGPAKPRNKGIHNSKGEWICFLDSDDWWYPEKLEVCSEYLADNNFIYHDLHIFSSTEKSQKRTVGSWMLTGELFVDLLTRGNPINTSSVVVKKELLLKVNCFSEDRELIFIEDFDCWLRISQIESKFYYLSQALGGYWIGDNSSVASERAINAIKYVYKKYLPLLDDNSKKKAQSSLDFRKALIFYSMREVDNAIFYFKRAFTMQPLVKKYHCLKFILICYYLKMQR